MALDSFLFLFFPLAIGDWLGVRCEIQRLWQDDWTGFFESCE